MNIEHISNKYGMLNKPSEKSRLKPIKLSANQISDELKTLIANK